MPELENEIQGEVPAIPEAEQAAPEAPPAETPPVDEAPDPAALKAEIEQLQADKEAAKEAAKKWRREKVEARADYFKNREPAPAAPAPAAETAKPNPDSFDDYNDYVEALTDYKVEAKRKEWDQSEAQKKESTTHQQRMQTLQEKINAGYDRYSDFEDVALAETVPITAMVMEALAETDNPADIAYYLGKNQPKAVAISRMTPIAAARAIAQIEASLSGTTPPPAQNKKITGAPPPIKPVGSSNTVTKDPEKMTQAEYNAYRLAQGAKRF